MITTQVWFNGYDITSSLTETDILDGTGIIVMVTLHISLGIYAQRLSRRLCLQPRIFEMMKLKLTTGVKVSKCIGFEKSWYTYDGIICFSQNNRNE